MAETSQKATTDVEPEGSLHQLQREKAFQEALFEASKTVLESADFMTTARHIFDAACAVTGAKSGYVALLNEVGDDNKVLFLEAGGMPCTVDESLPMPIRGLRGEAYRTQRAVYDNNFMNSEWVSFMPEGHVALKNVMFAPLNVQGKTVGILGLANKSEDFTDNDTRIAEAFGQLAAIALQNSRALEAQQQNERYLRTILNTTADGFWMLDISGKVIQANEAYCRMTGYTQEEMVGLHINDIDACETPEDTQLHIKRLTKKDFEIFESLHRRKDGSLFPVEISATFVPEYGGQIICFCRDITGRKAAADRIALLGHMLDAAPASITIHDMNGHFLFANRKTYTMHGYDSEEEFKAVNLHDLDVPESEALLAERFRIIAEKGEARFEVAHYRKDGSTFPLEVFAKTIEWNGKPAILSIATDITKRKQAEEALRESERKWRNILVNTPQLGIGLDPQARIIFANSHFLKVTGWREEEILGKNYFDMFIPEDIREEIRGVFDAAMHADESFGLSCYENEILTKAGELRNVAWSNLATKGLDGKVVDLTCLGVDLTERKKAEVEQQKLQEQLSQAQKMESIGRLAGGVAHDFNNMLNVILGNADFMQEDLPKDQIAIREGLEEIKKAAQRSADLTRQLLAFARKQTVSPKVLDLNETIESMLKMLRRLVGENIKVRWKPAMSLESVRIDPAQIDQMLANLMVNARDAIGSKDGNITIETGMSSFDADFCKAYPEFSPGKFCMFSIADNGCGMDEVTRSQIFEPFFTTKGVGEGTGLGLATVYGIVQQNNGIINVYSEPGKGTTFRIYLPVYQDRTETTSHEKSVYKILDPGHETILLVEDEPSILKMTTKMLSRMGYTVLAAATPGEAIHLAQEHAGEVHLLMTDVVMPEMNGRELAKRILTLHPKMRRLFMSGYTADIIAHHGVIDEGMEFIQKPFSKKDLEQKLREILNA
jgi:two-component system, cell cycle sensor histidine kinase and response regulator CckA